MFQIPDRFRSTPAKAIVAATLFAAGCGLGASAAHTFWPPAVMAPAKPVPISSLAGLTQPLIGERIVAVAGEVAEVYGSQFVLQDASGRILVGMGHRGDAQGLVGPDQKISVQGQLYDGVLMARFLTGADGQVTALKGGRGGHGHRHGPHGSREGREAAGRMPPSPTATPPENAPAPAPIT